MGQGGSPRDTSQTRRATDVRGSGNAGGPAGKGASAPPGQDSKLVRVLRHEVEIEQALVGFDEPSGDRPRHTTADRAAVDR